MAALDKEALADVAAYGQATEKLTDQYIDTILKAHALDIRRKVLVEAALDAQNTEAGEAFLDLASFYKWMQANEECSGHLAYTSLSMWKTHLKHFAYVRDSIYTSEELEQQDWREEGSSWFQTEFSHRAKSQSIVTQKDCKNLKPITVAQHVMHKLHGKSDEYEVRPPPVACLPACLPDTKQPFLQQVIQQLQMENERLKQMLDGAEEPSAEGLKKIVEQQQVELERQKVELESKDGAIQLLAEKMPEAELLTLAQNNKSIAARFAERKFTLKQGRCDDKFYTPDPIAQAAISMIDFRDGDFVLEPAKGGGAYYDKIPQHLEKDYCEIAEGISFIEMREKDELLFAAYEPPKPVDVIVTNPEGVGAD